MTDKIKERLWSIISSDLPPDHDLDILRKVLLLNLIILLGCFFLVLLGTTAFIQRDYVLGAMDFAVFSFLICMFLYLRKTKNTNPVAIITTVASGIFFAFLIGYGGVNKTAFVWSFTYPLIALFLLGTRVGTVMSLVLLGLEGVVFALGTRIDFFTSYRTDLIIRFIPSYFAIFLFAFVMEKVRERIQSRLRTSNVELEKVVEDLETADQEKVRLIRELRETLDEVKTLQGILPICANCKKIRDDSGYWEQVEKYVQDRSKARFSHGICPECAKKLYPDIKIFDDP